MRGLGLSTRLDRGTPVVRILCLDEGPDGYSVLRAVTHTARAGDDLAQRLRKIADDVDGIVRDLLPDVVVVRAPDYSQFGPRREVLRNRSLVDGVLLESARRRAERVVELSGRQIGIRCGTSKEAVEERSGSIVPDDEYVEAGAAALAALALSRD